MNPVFLNSIPWIAALAALGLSAAVDLRERRIPNELVLTVAGCGVLLGVSSWPAQLGLGLLVAAAVAFALGALAHRGVLGFGDVKLIAAATLLAPPARVAGLLVTIALAGGVLSSLYLVGYLAARKLPVPTGGPRGGGRIRPLHRFLRSERARIAGGRSVPYAMAIFGGVAAYATGEAVRWFYATS